MAFFYKYQYTNIVRIYTPEVKPIKDQAMNSPEHRLVDREGYTDVDNARAPPSDIPEI